MTQLRLISAIIRWTTPDYSRITGPIVTGGAFGETEEARSFSVLASTPQLARRLRFRSFGKDVSRDTSGVWAIVPIRVAARQITTNIQGPAWLAADGRQYDHSNRVRGATSLIKGRSLQPGLPERGILVFELPRSALAGGALILSNVPSPQLDSQIKIALSGQVPTDVAEEINLDGIRAP
jgi:hypothetical protein